MTNIQSFIEKKKQLKQEVIEAIKEELNANNGCIEFNTDEPENELYEIVRTYLFTDEVALFYAHSIYIANGGDEVMVELMDERGTVMEDAIHAYELTVEELIGVLYNIGNLNK